MQDPDISSNLPFVSVCTPTYNRRKFINMIIQCFNNQTYPKERMEWIILDDGTDKIEDLVKDIPQVRYFKYDIKMTISKKRNIINSLSKGDIIIYMDDDDYNPPDRIEHAVNVLTKPENKNILCAGSDALYTYFFRTGEIWKFGPIFKNHATAGTFAFKKELLNITSFNENDKITEETHFLKNYKIPLVQLDPFKTIICLSHKNNTFDKELLLKNPRLSRARKTNFDINNLITDENIKEFLKQERLLYSTESNITNQNNNQINKRIIPSKNIISRITNQNQINKINPMHENIKHKKQFKNKQNYEFKLFL